MFIYRLILSLGILNINFLTSFLSVCLRIRIHVSISTCSCDLCALSALHHTCICICIAAYICTCIYIYRVGPSSLSIYTLFWLALRPLYSHESLSLCVTSHEGKVYTDDNFIGLILSLLFEEARPCVERETMSSAWVAWQYTLTVHQGVDRKVNCHLNDWFR